MSAEYTYDYSIVRVVPRVDRGERINVGVILSCAEMDFLDARIELDEAALRALDPAVDIAAIRANLDTIPAVCRGGPEAGPIGELPARGRFRWLVVAAQHDHSAVGRPHRPHLGSGREPGTPDGSRGPATRC